MSLLGKKFIPPQMAAIFKIPQFSRRPQSEYASVKYLMRRKNDVLFMHLSKKLTEQRRCEVILMCLYKALVFQANFLGSSRSSSGYIS